MSAAIEHTPATPRTRPIAIALAIALSLLPVLMYPWGATIAILGFVVMLFAWPRLTMRAAISPARLLAYVWLPAIALSLLGLSGIERPLTAITFVAIGSAALAFALGQRIVAALTGPFAPADRPVAPSWNPARAIPALWLVLAISLLFNAYVYTTQGYLPITAANPDEARFTLAETLGGITELGVALAKHTIVLALALLGVQRGALTKRQRLAVLAVFPASLFLLALWFGRLNATLAFVVGGFAYVLAAGKSRRWVLSWALAVLVPLVVIVPMVREQLSFGDNYFQSITEFRHADLIGGMRYPYAITVYNVQSLQSVLEFVKPTGAYHGSLSLWGIAKVLRLPVETVDLPWDRLFAGWWITGTALSAFYGDFGVAGLLGGAMLAGAISRALYWTMRARPNEIRLILYAYWGFVLLFSIYVWYPARPEIYLDSLIFLAFHFFARQGRRSGNSEHARGRVTV